MSFLSLIAALLLEQVRPLRPGNAVHALYLRYAELLEQRFNGGRQEHGIIAWCFAAVLPVLATLAIYVLLRHASPLLAWAWNVAVLYFTMGFRQFSHYYNEILHALQNGEADRARECLSRWRGAPSVEPASNDIARVAIELGLVSSHRHVFGPIASFVVLGAAGAVLYRTAALLAQRWGARTDPEFGTFGQFADRFFYWLDWLPSRVTAVSFAIVGNFEDAVYSWRTQAASWALQTHGIILSSGAGAIGVRLGEPVHHAGGPEMRVEAGAGEEADVDYMQSAVGLIWRALVLWMFLILLVSIAYSLGA
ncbi:MAG TPA: CobD/CbiB family protein [Burkholderiales bacterium]|nr:CobD/CbiB family protein [Burkholderiales bacterium]